MVSRPPVLSIIAVFLLFAIIRMSFAQPYSLIYRNGFWPKNDVRVCFGDSSHVSRLLLSAVDPNNPEWKPILPEQVGDFPEIYRKPLRELIDREFTKERTTIHFTGWKSCSDDLTDTDVVLVLGRPDFKSSTLQGQASIGENLDIEATDSNNDKKFPQYKGYVYLKHPDAQTSDDLGGFTRQTTPEDSFLITALHEFGHLVGLGHEQARIYRGQTDRNCEYILSYYSRRVQDYDLPPLLGKNVDITGKHDPNSIMNYCWIDLIDSVTGLDFVSDSSLPAFQPKLAADVPYLHRPGKRKVADRPVKQDGKLPADTFVLTDPTVFTSTRIDKHRTRTQVKITLSQGDLHSIHCLYRYDEKTRAEKCRLPAPERIGGLNDPDMVPATDWPSVPTRPVLPTNPDQPTVPRSIPQ